MTFEWTVFVRDAQRNRVAELEDYRQLTLIPRFNDIGTFDLELDRRAAQAANLTEPGYGIVVVRNGQTLMSGAVVERDEKVDEKESTLILGGKDDNCWLKNRQASPAPAEAMPPYSTAEYDVRTGVCSTILRQYVNVNLGPGAVAARRHPGVVLGSDPAAGVTVTGRGRWQVLLTLLQELATTAGIGFRLVQVGSNIEFQTYQPVDRSASVKFSIELGNLAAYAYKASAPEANYVFVGGGGEGTARTIVEKYDPASIATWGRIEGEFVDRRDTTDTTELGQAGSEALIERQEKASLSITPIDTPNVSFGVHYGLGDKVTVQTGDGATISNIIREVRVELTPDGPQTVKPVLGTPGRDEVLGVFAKVRQLTARLNRLERR